MRAATPAFVAAATLSCGGKVIDSGGASGVGDGGALPPSTATSTSSGDIDVPPAPTMAPPPPPPPTMYPPPPPPPPTTTYPPPPPPPPMYPPPPPPPDVYECVVEDIGGATGEAVVSGTPWNMPGSVDSCVGRGPDAVVRWVVPHTGDFELNTRGSTYDTVLALRSGSCQGPEIVCNDDAIGVQSLVEWSFRGGEEVFIVVDSYGEFGGAFVLNIREIAPILDPASCEIIDLGSSTGAVAGLPLPNVDYGLENDCGGDGRAAVFGWQVPADGSYEISTAGSGFDTVLDVRDGCVSPPNDCNDDTATVQSRLVVDAVAGQYVVIVVQGYGGEVFADETIQLSIQPLP